MQLRQGSWYTVHTAAPHTINTGPWASEAEAESNDSAQIISGGVVVLYVPLSAAANLAWGE